VRREFTLDDDAMGLILGLLDQVYGLRRQLSRLCQALETQPPEIRDAIRRALPAAGHK
jgi:chaperone modulatory protein CbpM